VKVSLARLLLIVAALIAVTATSVVAYILWSRPVQLRVAVGPQDGADAAILAAFDRVLEGASAGVRLKPVTTAGLHENNVLLGRQEVDLAVVRLDEAFPTTAALVAILRTDAVIAVAPAHHKLENLSDLDGKRLGLISRSPLDEPTFVGVLDVLGLKPADVKLTIVKPVEIGPLTSSEQIDAVVVIGAPADPEVSAVVYAVAGTKKAPPTILTIDIGEFLKQSSAGEELVKIPKHAFPRRLVPHAEVETIGVPTVLAANQIAAGPIRTKVYNDAITELTQVLIERRMALARQVPLASLIAAPDSGKGARFPVHDGAKAYLSDTEVTWAALLSEQMWNIVLVGAILSSGFAAAASFIRRNAKDPMRELLDQLRAITERARTATDPADVDVLRQELSTIAEKIAMHGYERRSGYEKFAPLQLAFENTRDAVEAVRTKTDLNPAAAHYGARGAPLEPQRPSNL
jgi:TRAP-type uncharacterized transport system substrate-binding protein